MLNPENKLPSTERTFLLFMFAFFLALMNCITHIDGDSYFKSSIVPEGVGLCADVLVISTIVSYMQSKAERRIKVTKEQRLREYMIFLLRHSFYKQFDALQNYKKPSAEFMFGSNHTQNQEFIEFIIKTLDAPKHDRKWKEQLRKHIITDLPSYRECLSIASTLSDAHFKAWMRFIYFATKITETPNIRKVEIQDLLRQIQKFDKASYDNKIYKWWN